MMGTRFPLWPIVAGAAVLMLFMTVAVWLMIPKKTNRSFVAGTQPDAPATQPAPAVLPNGQLAPEVLQRVKQATVYLRVTSDDGRVFQGSGFFGVEPGVVLTNAHVIGMLEPESRPPRQIDGTLNGGQADEKKITCQVLGVDRTSDLAVLRATPVAGAQLPQSLEVKSARNLLETQEVFIFGFPFGDKLGKEITVGKSSVSSLRKDKDGVLRQVQVNGGMNPGNSGGPVVDSRGDVIGVAVQIIVATPINFAVAGDQVKQVCEGRVSGVSLGQSYLDSGRMLVPVTVHKIDPLGRMKQFGLEVWTGERGQSRPACTAQPPAQPGDTSHQRQMLDNRPQQAAGNVPLPPLPAGKVYWIQPVWSNANNQTLWDAAAVHEVAPPIERRPANLLAKHTGGDRPLQLNSRWTWKLAGGDDDDRSFVISTEARMKETVRGSDTSGTASVRLDYTGFERQVMLDNEPATPDARAQRLVSDILNLGANMTVDRQGLAVRTEIDISRVPALSRKDLIDMHERVHQALEVVTIPWPNREIQPQTSWKMIRSLPIDRPGRHENGSLDMTYTYQGSRVRDGRAEAVVGISGHVRGRAGREVTVAGRAEGTAVFDLVAGTVSQVDAKVFIDTNGDSGMKANGVLEVKLLRDVKGTR
jgi:S1-C subfamily serine protease